jgi:hypothetical protein
MLEPLEPLILDPIELPLPDALTLALEPLRLPSEPEPDWGLDESD